MTLKKTIRKVEDHFGEKMNYNQYANVYFLNGLSFHEQENNAICIQVSGCFYSNISQALRRYSK